MGAMARAAACGLVVLICGCSVPEPDDADLRPWVVELGEWDREGETLVALESPHASALKASEDGRLRNLSATVRFGNARGEAGFFLSRTPDEVHRVVLDRGDGKVRYLIDRAGETTPQPTFPLERVLEFDLEVGLDNGTTAVYVNGHRVAGSQVHAKSDGDFGLWTDGSVKVSFSDVRWA